MLNHLWKQDKFFVSLIIILFSVIYITSLPSVNVGYSDSDQLIAVAAQGGVAHPPGYPLYMLLLSAWIKFPLIAGTIAFRAHLLSTIFGITTLVILYKTTRYLLAFFAPDSLSISTRQLIATISVISIGISPLFWLYSIVTEVFAFHILLATALIYRSIVSILLKPTSKKFWLINAALLGLALSHHQTIVLIASFILIALWVNFRTFNRHYWIQSFAIFLATIVLSYSFLWIQNNNHAQLSWQMQPGLRGLIRHILREEFSGVVPETGEVVSAYLPKVDPQSIYNNFPIYLKQLVTQFGFFTPLAAIFGLIFLLTRHRPLGLAFLFTLLITGPIFSGILGWPEHFGSQANLQRLLLMGYLLWPLLFSLGFNFIIYRLKLGLNVLNFSVRGFLTAIFVVFFSFHIIHLYHQYPQSTLRNFNFISKTYSSLLTQVKPNALVACFTDTSCFALMYEQSVNHLRPDVIIIPRAYPLMASKLAQYNDLRHFTYDSDPFRTFDYITWNLDKRPVYAVDISEYYYHLLGINEGFTYYIPYGVFGELTRQQQTLPPSDFNLAQSIMSTPIPSTDRMRLYYISNVIRTYQLNSLIELRSNNRNQAREELNVAGNLDNYLGLQASIDTKFEAYRKSVESSQIDPRFDPGQKPISLDQFLDLIHQWQQKRRLDVAHKLAIGAIAVYPDSVSARLAAAETFQQINQIQASLTEYRNVLILDPKNQQALDALSKLQPLINSPSSPK